MLDGCTGSGTSSGLGGRLMYLYSVILNERILLLKFTLTSYVLKDPESKELAHLFIKYLEWQDVLVSGARESGDVIPAVGHSLKI